MYFPKEFPDVGGKSFKEVANDPKYFVFCNFVENIIKDPTGIFLVFRTFLKTKRTAQQ